MARKTQSQSSRSQDAIGTFRGLLVRAIAWLVAAILVPTGAIATVVPEAAPYVHWAPILFYAMALWSFTRAVRALLNTAANGVAPRARMPGVGTAQPGRPPQAGKSRPDAKLAISRAPAVQRMR